MKKELIIERSFEISSDFFHAIERFRPYYTDIANIIIEDFFELKSSRDGVDFTDFQLLERAFGGFELRLFDEKHFSNELFLSPCREIFLSYARVEAVKIIISTDKLENIIVDEFFTKGNWNSKIGIDGIICSIDTTLTRKISSVICPSFSFMPVAGYDIAMNMTKNNIFSLVPQALHKNFGFSNVYRVCAYGDFVLLSSFSEFPLPTLKQNGRLRIYLSVHLRQSEELIQNRDSIGGLIFIVCRLLELEICEILYETRDFAKLVCAGERGALIRLLAYLALCGMLDNFGGIYSVFDIN